MYVFCFLRSKWDGLYYNCIHILVIGFHGNIIYKKIPCYYMVYDCYGPLYSQEFLLFLHSIKHLEGILDSTMINLTCETHQA